MNTPNERIRSARTRVGITQEELAESSGLSPRTIQRIESGETVPRGDSLKRIAAALQSQVEDFLPEQQTTQVTEPKIAWIIHFSAFAFLVHPLLGLALPLSLYLVYKGSNHSVRRFGKRVVVVEGIYCAILGIVFGYILAARIFRLPVPGFIPYQSLIIGVMLFAVAHFITLAALCIDLLRKSNSAAKITTPLVS